MKLTIKYFAMVKRFEISKNDVQDGCIRGRRFDVRREIGRGGGLVFVVVFLCVCFLNKFLALDMLEKKIAQKEN